MWSNKAISPARAIPLLLFAALIGFPVVAAAQLQSPKGESTISGRVIFADTGKPVRRATVRLFYNLSHRPLRVTPANVRGEFRFNEVAAGAYFVIADAPGGFSSLTTFGITEFGTNSDAEAQPTRVSVDGKGAVRCEVRAFRAGTIRGTIVYSDKEPVTGAPIVLFRRKNGATIPFFTKPIETNDRGMYRIDGLPEGEYFVGVMDARSRVRATRAVEMRGVVTAYYPGVVSIVDAKPIQVQSGSEVNAINFTLGDDQLRQVSGVVKWRDGGKRVGKAVLTLRRMDEPKVEASFHKFLKSITAPGANSDDFAFRDIGLLMMTLPPTMEANAKGEWKFDDVPPGKYVLGVHATLSDKDRPVMSEEELTVDTPSTPDVDGSNERMVSRQMELTVADEDLKDLVVEISDGGRISGVVVADDVPVPRLRLSIVRRERETVEDLWNYRSKENGSFLLEGVQAGDVRLEVITPFQLDVYVKSITLGSQDLMRSPLRVVEGAEVTGVRITLAKDLATLTGRALFDEDGSLAGGSGVLLVKSDPTLWQLSGARIFTVTDPAGEFALKCAPGEYLVFTWAPGNQPLQSVEDFVRTNASSARRITLQSSEQKQIELTVAKPKK